MLIFPILNRERIINVRVKLKTANKIAQHVSHFNIGPSEIFVSNHKFSESAYKNTVSTPQNVMEFIRNSLKTTKSNVIVTTKIDINTGLYDIYEVNIPDKVSENLDQLLGALILDLKNEDDNNKNRYLDFKKLRVLEDLTQEKLDKMSFASTNMKYMDVNKYVNDNNLLLLFKTLPLFNYVDFEIIKGSIIEQEKFEQILNFFREINTKDYKSLNSFYKLAKDNQQEYAKLQSLNKSLNNTPLNLIHNSKVKKINKNGE